MHGKPKKTLAVKSTRPNSFIEFDVDPSILTKPSPATARIKAERERDRASRNLTRTWKG